MRQTTNHLLFQLEECRNAINECEIVRSKLAVNSPAMLRLRDLAVARLPVQLVLYWGVWRRAALQTSEHAFMDQLDALAAALSRTLDVSCELCIIATDTHARLNGVSDEVIEAYIENLRAVASARDVNLDRLSTLMANAPALVATRSPEGFQPPLKWQRLRTMLTVQAAKLFADSDARAAAYELANLMEGGAVLRTYPTGIFLHTGVPELRPLLCSLPTVHIYTGLGRKTRKPWFEDEDGAAGVKAEL